MINRDDSSVFDSSRGRARSQSQEDAAKPTQSRDEVLRQELANVKKTNEAIEALLKSLEKAKSNMKTVHTTVGSTSQLLNTWTRILSQTEHNQRLILDPSWQGASQDIADIEEEAQAKQQAADRREAEEHERKAAVAKKAEEDEKRKVEAASRPGSRVTSRGKGRGTRGTGTSVSTTATPASSNSSLLRAPSTHRRGVTGPASGIGRARGLRGKQ